MKLFAYLIFISCVAVSLSVVLRPFALPLLLICILWMLLDSIGGHRG